jgi:CHAT domain-containing protein
VLSQLHQVQVYLDEGNFSQASRLLEAASKAVPAEYAAYVQAIAGNLALRQGDYSQAIALYQSLLSSGLGGAGNQLTLLNNYTQALLKRQQIYQAQATDDLERRSDYLAAARHERQQARESAQKASALVGTTGNSEAEIRARLNLADLGLNPVDGNSLSQDILALPISRTQVELLLDLAQLSRDPLPLLQKAVQVAQDLGDARSRSWAWGALGRYYQQQGDYPLALKLSQQAQWSAQEALDWARLVQWQGQAARIYQQLGEPPKALRAYRQAVESLQTLRQELAGNRVSQSLFLDTIAPLLRGYLALLLSQPPAPETLQEAISVLKFNQLAELDNYFGSVCQVTPQKTVRHEHTATIYTAILPQATYEILEAPDQTYSLFSLPVPAPAVQQQVLTWRQDLQNPFTKEYQRGSRALYASLLRPLEESLEAQKITHLVFVQDGVLRNVPMAALYDTRHQQFLVERFAISYSLGLGGAVAPVRPQSPLIVGTSEATASFPNPLPGVVRETQALQALLGGTDLLNQAFTKESLAARLQNREYQLLHVASHGRFTGLAEEAIIETGKDAISLQEFEQILRNRQSPLTHLTLSACETAQGSRYAVLGLAGVGIRAGIASVLGTLWFTGDEKTADFVLYFYRAWIEGNTLEQALRKSQLRQIHQGMHPANWTDFVLLKA